MNTKKSNGSKQKSSAQRCRLMNIIQNFRKAVNRKWFEFVLKHPGLACIAEAFGKVLAWLVPVFVAAAIAVMLSWIKPEDFARQEHLIHITKRAHRCKSWHNFRKAVHMAEKNDDDAKELAKIYAKVFLEQVEQRRSKIDPACLRTAEEIKATGVF